MEKVLEIIEADLKVNVVESPHQMEIILTCYNMIDLDNNRP